MCRVRSFGSAEWLSRQLRVLLGNWGEAVRTTEGVPPHPFRKHLGGGSLGSRGSISSARTVGEKIQRWLDEDRIPTPLQ